MKGLKYVKKMNEETIAFSQLINSYSAKINKEYMKQMIHMLENIAHDENLDINVLKQKYIKKLPTIDEEDDEVEPELLEAQLDEKHVLDKITYNGTVYYVDKQNNNITYDSKKTVVGKWENGKIILI